MDLKKFDDIVQEKAGKSFDMLLPVKFAIEATDDNMCTYYIKYDIGKGHHIHAKVSTKTLTECEYVTEGHLIDDKFACDE